MKAKKLDFQALKYISDNYLKGDDEKLDDEKIEEDIDSFSGNVNMEKVDKILQEAIDKLEDGEFDKAPDMDGFIAPKLHEATDLTRREAADPEFWNYMSLIFKPEFVRKRWPSCARNRFIMRTSTDRHALSRLWWIAELTERDGDYRYTEIAFSNQDIAQNIFDNDFSHFEQILPPVLERLKDAEKTSSVATKYGEIFNRRFAVLLEEDMDAEQLGELADEVHERALQEIEMETS